MKFLRILFRFYIENPNGKLIFNHFCPIRVRKPVGSFFDGGGPRNFSGLRGKYIDISPSPTSLHAAAEQSSPHGSSPNAAHTPARVPAVHVACGEALKSSRRRRASFDDADLLTDVARHRAATEETQFGTVSPSFLLLSLRVVPGHACIFTMCSIF